VLLLIGYRGVMAIMTGETGSGSAPAPAASSGSAFPSALASAYALQFGQVYLNADPATASQRASELATFLPADTDSQLGWNESGSLQLQSEQVAKIAVQDAHHALMTLLARVNGQLMELGVPIYYLGGALAVSGESAWLPAPAKASVPTPSAPTSDAATQSELMSQLPAFFQAYASGDQVTIDRFLAPGTHVTGAPPVSCPTCRAFSGRCSSGSSGLWRFSSCSPGRSSGLCSSWCWVEPQAGDDRTLKGGGAKVLLTLAIISAIAAIISAIGTALAGVAAVITARIALVSVVKLFGPTDRRGFWPRLGVSGFS
jgi:hypothetical protein